MKKLKNFKTFIKENKDTLDNQVTEFEGDDILMNMKDIPSELWTEEMSDAYAKYENNQNELEFDIENLDNLENLDNFEDIEPGDKKMMHKREIPNEISESYSELDDYELKNVFEEEEDEEED